jgi:hypothetical protein
LTNPLILDLLLFEQSLQIFHVVVFEVLDETAGGLETLLYGETCRLVPGKIQINMDSKCLLETKLKKD